MLSCVSESAVCQVLVWQADAIRLCGMDFALDNAVLPLHQTLHPALQPSIHPSIRQAKNPSTHPKFYHKS